MNITAVKEIAKMALENQDHIRFLENEINTLNTMFMIFVGIVGLIIVVEGLWRWKGGG